MIATLWALGDPYRCRTMLCSGGKRAKEGTMRERAPRLVVVVIALLTMAPACGSGEGNPGGRSAVAVDQPAEDTTADVGDSRDSGDAQQISGVEPDDIAVTSDDADTLVDDGDTTRTDDGTTDENPLPNSADPCSEPVDFSAISANLVGWVGYATTFTAAGESRSLDVRFSSPDAPTAENAVMVVMFHGAGGSNAWSKMNWANSFLPELVQQRPVITVMAQAVNGRSGRWPSDTFVGTEYHEALRATLAKSFCLEQMPIILHGNGQGTIVALNAYCTGSLPADAIVLVLGMAKLLDCPADPTPVMTLDIYEFQPVVGHHWGGAWNPPMAEIVEITGGIQSTPDDVDHWASQFGCESEPTETLLPIDSHSTTDQKSQPITVLAVRDCVEPIVAIGVPGRAAPMGDAPFFVDRGVLELVNEVMLAELTAALE